MKGPNVGFGDDHVVEANPSGVSGSTLRDVNVKPQESAGSTLSVRKRKPSEGAPSLPVSKDSFAADAWKKLIEYPTATGKSLSQMADLLTIDPQRSFTVALCNGIQRHHHLDTGSGAFAYG